MARFYEIPLRPLPMQFITTLRGRDYRFTTQYRDALYAGWVLDIDAVLDPEIAIHGIMLVTGLDLLWQYDYFELGFRLLLQSDIKNDTPGRFELGATDHLLAVIE